MAVIKYTDKDNVVTVLDAVGKGERVTFGNDSVDAVEDIKIFHKMAVTPILKDGEVIKYGEVIGHALFDINPGEWVHVHNIESMRGRGDKSGGVK